MISLAGLLLAMIFATSALVKIRSGRRVGIGIGVGVMLELGVAVVVAATPVLTGRLPLSLVVGAVAVSGVGSGLHITRLRALRQARADTEGGRLAAYVKYLSGPDQEG